MAALFSEGTYIRGVFARVRKHLILFAEFNHLSDPFFPPCYYISSVLILYLLFSPSTIPFVTVPSTVIRSLVIPKNLPQFWEKLQDQDKLIRYID